MVGTLKSCAVPWSLTNWQLRSVEFLRSSGWSSSTDNSSPVLTTIGRFLTAWPLIIEMHLQQTIISFLDNCFETVQLVSCLHKKICAGCGGDQGLYFWRMVIWFSVFSRLTGAWYCARFANQNCYADHSFVSQKLSMVISIFRSKLMLSHFWVECICSFWPVDRIWYVYRHDHYSKVDLLPTWT